MVLTLIATLPVAISVALAAKSFASRVLAQGSLSDFRAGPLALTGESKVGEIFLPFVLFGVLLVFSLLVLRRLRNDHLTGSERHFLVLESVLALPAVIPFVLGFGVQLLDFIDHPILLSLMLQAPPAAFVLALPKALRWSKDCETVRNLVAPALWSVAALPLAVLGLIVGVRYLIAPVTLPWILWAGLAVSAIIVPAVIYARSLSKFQTHSFRITGWVLAALAIGSLPLLMPPLMEANGGSGVLPGVNLTAWQTFLIVAGLVILGETSIRQRLQRQRQWMAAVSSFAVAALIVPLRGVYHLPTISSDDFHVGERLSPPILWNQFSQIPYVELILPRGLLANVAPGTVNSLLHDGSVAMDSYVNLAIAFLVVGISHSLLRTIVGFLPATAMVALVAVANSYLEGDLLVTALLVASMGWILHRIKAPLLGLGLATIMTVAVLAYPLMGVASLIVLTAVILISAIGALLGNAEDVKYAIAVVGSLLVAGLVIMQSPVGHPTHAAIQYVLTNASGNSEAFGIALDQTWRTPFALGQILSMAFVLGAFVSVWILWVKRRTLLKPSWATYAELAIAATPALFALGLFGRYLGRIDPDEWLSRSAAGSLIVIGLIAPTVLFLSQHKSFSQVAWVLISVATIISLAIAPVGVGSLLRSSVMAAPANWVSIDAVEVVPRLGYGQGDQTHIASIVEIKSAASNLPAGEPVLNLSNRGALYGYMDWSNPLGYLAPYNIPSAHEEQAVVDRLAASPPRVAFVGPGVQLDGISLTLRNPSLSRWVMDNYTPVQCGLTVWAILNSTQDSERTNLLNCPNSVAGTLVDSSALWASSIGAPSSILHIPASWGARAPDEGGTRTEFPVGAQTVPDGMQGFAITFPNATQGTQVSRPDLLELHVSCPSNPKANAPTSAAASLEWDGSSEVDDTNVSIFHWGVGRLLVPLDAYPTWQRDISLPEQVRLSAPHLDCPEGWRVQAFGKFR